MLHALLCRAYKRRYEVGGSSCKCWINKGDHLLFTWSAGGAYRNFDLSNIFSLLPPSLYINNDWSLNFIWILLGKSCIFLNEFGGGQIECIMRDFEGSSRFAISWFHPAFKWIIASLRLNLAFLMQVWFRFDSKWQRITWISHAQDTQVI